MVRKQSKQRDIILHYINSIHEHVSAEQIFENINQETKVLSLATVYRNLNILVEMNEIRKIAHPVYGYVYDRVFHKHYHLYCTKCHRLIDLELPYMDELDQKIENDTGMNVFSHDVMMEGICNSCKNHN